MRTDFGQQRRETALQVIDEVIFSLPEDVRRHAESVRIVLDDVPDPTIKIKGIPGSLLGLFRGYPLRGPAGRGLEETTIYLFLDNLWRQANGDWDRFCEETRITYLHELGHYLGLNEAELRSRKL